MREATVAEHGVDLVEFEAHAHVRNPVRHPVVRGRPRASIGDERARSQRRITGRGVTGPLDTWPGERAPGWPARDVAGRARGQARPRVATRVLDGDASVTTCVSSAPPSASAPCALTGTVAQELAARIAELSRPAPVLTRLPPGAGPAVYVTVRCGRWAQVPPALRRLHPRLTWVVPTREYGVLGQALVRARRADGGHYVTRARALRPCLQTLRGGGAVGFEFEALVGHGEEVELFDEALRVDALPVRLARRCGRPLVFVEARPAGAGTIALHCHPPLHMADEDTAVLQQLCARIATAIDAAPTSWMSDRPLWETTNAARRCWNQVFEALRYHDQGGADPTALASLNRVFRKVTRAGDAPLPELSPRTCGIECMELDLAALASLRRYHTRSTPKRESRVPLIAVAHDDALYVVDGQNRLNRQLAQGMPKRRGHRHPARRGGHRRLNPSA